MSDEKIVEIDEGMNDESIQVQIKKMPHTSKSKRKIKKIKTSRGSPSDEGTPSDENAPKTDFGDLFADMGDIVLEVTEEIPEYQRIYKDEEIYRKELENQFLNDLPVNKQSSKYWQDQVTEKVDQIMELYRSGQYIMKNGGMEYYKLFHEYLSNEFTQSWIIPIVIDSKKIYRKIDPDRPVDENIPESEYVADTPLTDGITLVDQKKELISTTQIQKAYKKNEMGFDKYFQLMREITYPYLLAEKLESGKSQDESGKSQDESAKTTGYHLRLDDYYQVLRLANVNNVFWEERVAQGPSYTIADQDGEGYKRRKVVQGENINIIGFFILPKDVKSVYQLLSRRSETYDKFGLVGDIEKITPAKSAVITVKNHGLSNDSKVQIVKAETIPTLNGEYTVQVLDDDRFTIPVNFTQGVIESTGQLFSTLKLPFEKRWIRREKEDFHIHLDTLNGSKLTDPVQIDKETAYLYQVEPIRVLSEDYPKLLELIIPNLQSILQVEEATLRTETMLKGLGFILSEYGLSLDDLTIEEIASWKKILEKNAEAELTDIEKERIKYHQSKSAKDAKGSKSAKSLKGGKKDKKDKKGKEEKKDKKGKKDKEGKEGKEGKEEGKEDGEEGEEGEGKDEGEGTDEGEDLLMTDKELEFILDNKDFILSDAYFYDHFIVNKYGEYPLKGSQYDTIDARLTWLKKTLDQGAYYFTWTNERIEKDEKKSLLKELEVTLKTLEADLKNNEKIYQQEYKIQKFFDKNCQKTTKIYDDFQELLDDPAIFPEGTKALVRPKYPKKITKASDIKNPTLYQRKDNSWESLGETSFFEYSQYCFFGDKEVPELDAKDLNCNYDPEYGCRGGRLIRYQKRIDLSQEAVENYQKQIDYLKKDELRGLVAKKMERYMAWLEAGKVDSKREKELLDSQSKSSATSKSKILSLIEKPGQTMAFSIIQILNKITQIPSDANRKYLIYKLIDRDGILVGNYIYSKKYESRMICGHWYFMRLEEQADNNEKKYQLRTRMLNQFGDGGEANKGIEACRICANYLDEVPYDDVSGFDKDGHLIRTHEVLTSEVDIDDSIDTQVDNIQLFCQTVAFKKELELKKIQAEDTFFSLCDILHSLVLKLNINLLKSHLLDILIDVLPYAKRIVPFEKYKRLEIVNLQKRGLPLTKINLLNERGYFTDKYQNYSASKKYVMVAVRLLITIQTAVPPYIISKVLAKCPFMGLEENQGRDFMICLLEEMEVFDQKLKKKDPETFRENTQKHFDEVYKSFLEKTHIQLLFSARKKYSVKITTVDTAEELKLDELLKKYQINELSVAQKKDRLLVAQRLMFLSLRIKELIHKAIKETPVINFLKVENTCCFQEVDQYGDYYNFINQEVDQLINEVKDLTRISRRFVNKGVVFHQYFQEKISMKTHNEIPFQINDKETDIIQKLFLSYCSTGVTHGQSHSWMEGEAEKICVKCKKNWKDIETTEYSVNDFNTLLNKISSLNFTLQTIEEKYPNIYLQLMEDIDKDDLANVNVVIKSFVDKLGKVMGKTQFSTEKYYQILLNLGNLNEIYDEKINDMKEEFKLKTKDNDTNSESNDAKGDAKGDAKSDAKSDAKGDAKSDAKSKQSSVSKKIDTRVIMICNQSDFTRISLIKKYINNYFRKYLSYVQNNVETNKQKIDVESMGINPKLAEELQIMIFKENEKYSRFMKQCQYFQELSFEFSAEKINNIFGYADRYNCAKTQVIQDSLFPPKEAVNLLIYLLVDQLNKFISSIPGGQDKKGYCHVIADFIITILDDIEDDKTYQNISQKDINKYQLVIKAETEKPTKSDESISEWEYTFGKFQDQIKEEKEDAPLNLDLLDADKTADVESKIKTDYMKKYGEEPTADTMDTLKSEYFKGLDYETNVLDKDYDLLQPKEGLEILDIGTEYGELAQGMETAGDGISDYSMDVLN